MFFVKKKKTSRIFIQLIEKTIGQLIDYQNNRWLQPWKLQKKNRKEKDNLQEI